MRPRSAPVTALPVILAAVAASAERTARATPYGAALAAAMGRAFRALDDAMHERANALRANLDAASVRADAR